MPSSLKILVNIIFLFALLNRLTLKTWYSSRFFWTALSSEGLKILFWSETFMSVMKNFQVSKTKQKTTQCLFCFCFSKFFFSTFFPKPYLSIIFNLISCLFHPTRLLLSLFPFMLHSQGTHQHRVKGTVHIGRWCVSVHDCIQTTSINNTEPCIIWL